MAWVILILVLLAAAFGVLGAVLKAAVFLVLTILLTLSVLAAIAWYAFKGQMRRWQDEVEQEQQAWIGGVRPPGSGPRDLPSHDDRY
jgi:membrane protein implicated in regulation of membrane protease activity